MPWINRVFEMLGIIYREREVPAKVLASIDKKKKKKKASAKNVMAEAESKKRKGAAVAQAPAKKKKTGALVIAPAVSSAGSAGVASAGSEDIQSSSVPSMDVRVTSGGVHGSPVALLRPVRGALSGAELPKASAAPACSLHGAASVVEQPEASAADPMPGIFGGLYSSSEEGAEVVLEHAPLSPAVVALSLAVVAPSLAPEVVLVEQAPVAQSSSSPPPARPLAEEIRPFGPSPHDGAKTSAQGARQVAQPWLFMSDVMAGLLTSEERAAAASGYHTAVVMDERCTREVFDRDATIEALKAENECLEGEKGGLANSLAALRLSLAEKEQEKEALRADVAKAQDAEVLSAEQAIVAEFGGKTSAPPEEDSVYALASWLKRHLAKLPGLINGCTDYEALAGVANYAKLLVHGGCTHTEIIPEGVLPGPKELAETSLGLQKTLRNFIGYFWAPFGRPAAQKLVEEKRAKDAQKSLAGRPPPVPCSATAGGASATDGAPVGATIGGGDGRRPQAPSPPTVDAGSVPGTSAAAEAPKV
ncbi:uncharacterized protein [Miscanthus floridulus]|uniref:uncharacterized protein n=1 Tax=Miscanthus floridulus TaxID=154761 RepID=UPI00345AB603